MRWFIRTLIVGLCLLLWVGLWFGAYAVAETAKTEPYKAPFPFPEFLPGSELYVWFLTEDAQFRTVLAVQNISRYTLANVEIVFYADGEELRFEAEYIPPGDKVFIAEKQKTAFDDWHAVSYVSYTAKEIEITSFPD